MRKTNVIKTCRKTYRKAAKAVGLSRRDTRRIGNTMKNYAYDTAVSVSTTLALDAIYTAVDVVGITACIAYSKITDTVGNLIGKITNKEDDELVDVVEKAEE